MGQLGGTAGGEMQAVLGPQLWTVRQAHCAAVASALAPSVLACCAAGAGKLPVDQPPSSADIPSQLGEQGDGLNEACEVDSIPHVFSAQCIVPAGVDNDAVKVRVASLWRVYYGWKRRRQK